MNARTKLATNRTWTKVCSGFYRCSEGRYEATYDTRIDEYDGTVKKGWNLADDVTGEHASRLHDTLREVKEIVASADSRGYEEGGRYHGCWKA
jgi:hypothetical protein